MVEVKLDRPGRSIALAEALTLEHVAYGLLILAAVVLRGLGLGWQPLGPAEAWQALPALAAARGQPYDLTGTSPLLGTLQHLTFALFGANEVLARLWSALLGGLAVLCFYALRDRLTREGALAAAVLWAFSPLAVFTARQGTGDALVPALALAFLAAVNLAVAPPTAPRAEGPSATPRSLAWLIVAAVVAGLLLTAGPAAYTVVVIGIAAAFFWRTDLVSLLALARQGWRGLVAAFFAALVFGATCFFLAPTGLAAAADLLGAWLAGLMPTSGEYGAWDIARRLLISEPLLLGFAGAGVARAAQRRDRFGLFVGIAAGIALFIAMVGQGRHPMALGLVALALVLLAGPAVADTLRHLFGWRDQSDPWFLVALELVLIATAAQCLPGALNSANKADWLLLYTVLGIITFTLAVLLWLVYGVFASWRTVAEALPVVLLVVGLLWSVSQLTAANYDRGAGRNAAILIVTADEGGLTDLRRALRELTALKGTGAREARLDLMLPPTMRTTIAPILRWELRDLPHLRVVNTLAADLPPLVITAADATAVPGETYGGAEFTVLRWWRPESLTGVEAWVRWLIYRETRGNALTQSVVLWVNRATSK